MTQLVTPKSSHARVIVVDRCIAAVMACRLRPMHLKLVSSKSAKLANHVRLFRSACSREAPPRGQIGIPFTKDGFPYVEYFAVPGKIILPKRIILMRHGQSLGNADESVSRLMNLLLLLLHGVYVRAHANMKTYIPYTCTHLFDTRSICVDCCRYFPTGLCRYSRLAHSADKRW